MSTRPDLVRVRLQDGAESSVGAAFAESHNLKVLKEPATDAVGRVLPTTYPDKPAAKKATPAKKTAAKKTAAKKDPNNGGEPAPIVED